MFTEQEDRRRYSFSQEDEKRGYPIDKEEAALFQLVIISVFILIIAFFLGQFSVQFDQVEGHGFWEKLHKGLEAVIRS